MANGQTKTKKRAKQRSEAQKPKQKCVKNNGERSGESAERIKMEQNRTGQIAAWRHGLTPGCCCGPSSSAAAAAEAATSMDAPLNQPHTQPAGAGAVRVCVCVLPLPLLDNNEGQVLSRAVSPNPGQMRQHHAFFLPTILLSIFYAPFHLIFSFSFFIFPLLSFRSRSHSLPFSPALSPSFYTCFCWPGRRVCLLWLADCLVAGQPQLFFGPSGHAPVKQTQRRVGERQRPYAWVCVCGWV